MTLTPDSMPFELVMSHPSYQKELTPELKEEINRIKDDRAIYSVSHGALPDWSEGYVKKDKPWAVLSPVANIVGILASFEAFKLIIQRPGLEPAIGPKLVKVDLASENMVKVETPEHGVWDNTTL
jgi:hypothetical protein